MSDAYVFVYVVIAFFAVLFFIASVLCALEYMHLTKRPDIRQKMEVKVELLAKAIGCMVVAVFFATMPLWVEDV
jgi:hypothetical protein